MRRLLLITAAVASAALAAPAAAAPDAPGCTQRLATEIALYDGPLESYPAFLAGALTRYAACVA